MVHDHDYRLSTKPHAPEVGEVLALSFHGILYLLEDKEGYSKDQKTEALEALNNLALLCLYETRLQPGKSQIDASTVYSTLKRLLKKWHAKRCSCCQCVFATDAFRQPNGTLHHECKDCLNNREAHDEARERARRERERLTDARWERAEVRSNGKVEDDLVRWVGPLLEAHGLVVRVMEEFRRTDVLVRRAEWTKEDEWVRIQVKADSGVQEDGTTLKSVNARIKFADCFGYGAGQSDAENAKHRMLMLCGARRVEGASLEGPVSYELWCFDGTLVDGETLAVSTIVGNDTLGKLKGRATTADKRSCSIEEVVERIDQAHTNPSFPTTTLDAAFVDVPQEKHRKEMILMLCLQHKTIDKDLSYPTGNSTSIDCTFRGEPTQCKTYDVAGATAHCSHRFRGVEHEPYDSSDKIKLLVEFFLVRQRKTDTFHLFYAQQTVEDLVANEVFTDVDNDKKHFSTRISPHLPEQYQKWVFGRTHETRVAWLKEAKNAFQKPLQVKPDHRLSLAMLHEVAHTSPMSTECPV